MKILITGGAGFIGSNFVHYMIRKHPEYEIVVLDKLTYAGKKENLQAVWNKITFIKGDITKKEDAEKVIKNCNWIVNFAAETHVDRSIIEAGTFVLTDVFGIYNLLEAARKFDISKFEQISTDEVYGHILKGSFKEQDRLNPRNPYSASKASAELLCKAYFETYGSPITITRSSNNYGPYQHPEKLIPKTIIYALSNKAIPIYGTGENIRDWIYVEDNCEAIDWVLHKGKLGEVYNIAANQEFKNVDVIRTILKLTRKPESLIEYVKDRPGHDLRYSLNTKKIREIGWIPKTIFNDGIKKTIDWYMRNTQWWMPIIEKEKVDFHKTS
ncbi:MAG: dTDP-glucose 4,6-dehydratase [Candidatus Bathyarchaeota archaeon]|nr:dTDP-glucose 4,6-dehydratase [Candidatus Bathyarchaeota archaeon]MDH5788375.1 dTDP-glucose 4,6-dehydratase [Candidatus Bathyarchaeota archaeon]